MLQLLLLLFVLVSLCVAIHGLGMVLGLRWLLHVSAVPRHDALSMPAMFWILVRVVYGLLLLHLLQVSAWAVCYQAAGCFPDFPTSFYYSASSYSTVGYGDIHPPERWRILGATEALTGVLMFGWSTGALFSVVNQLLSRLRSHSSSETR